MERPTLLFTAKKRVRMGAKAYPGDKNSIAVMGEFAGGGSIYIVLSSRQLRGDRSNVQQEIMQSVARKSHYSNGTIQQHISSSKPQPIARASLCGKMTAQLQDSGSEQGSCKRPTGYPPFTSAVDNQYIIACPTVNR